MATEIETILKLSVPLIVRVGECSASMKDVLALGPGAILELNKLATDDLDLMVNNKPIGSGRAVKVGENFGVRVTAVGPTAQRVAAMGDTEA